MGIQAKFNSSAIELLPAVKKAIAAARRIDRDFEANQMTCFAVQHINNLGVPLDDQDNKSIIEKQLLHIFALKEWM